MNRRSTHKSSSAHAPASGPATGPGLGRGAEHSTATGRQTTAFQNASADVAAVTLTAVLAALAVWVIAVPVAGVALVAGSLAVSPVAVALVSLGSGCAAGLSYSIMRRFRGGAVMWTVTACVVLILSMAGPLLSGAADAALVALELMHLTVGVTIILGLRRFVPSNPGRLIDRGATASDSEPSTALPE
jgi:hypothetical protein